MLSYHPIQGPTASITDSRTIPLLQRNSPWNYQLSPYQYTVDYDSKHAPSYLFTPMSRPIGFLGTGLMGAPMAAQLLVHNYNLIAYNRTPDKLAPLSQAGAQAADSPAAVFASADCIVLMLTDAAAIQSLLPAHHLANKTIVQMGTIAPQESQAIAQQVHQAGGTYLEAPVLGSIPEAKTGNLIVMVGAEPTVFEACLPLLKCFGPDPKHIGPVGSAAALKLALNQLIGAMTTAFSVSLGLTQRYGVNSDMFMDILRTSALYAPTFDKKLKRMEDRNFEAPNFPTKHLLKDMQLCLQSAQSIGLETATLEAICDLLRHTVQTHANRDYSAVFSTVCPAVED